MIRAMAFSAGGTRLVVQAADFETTCWDVHLEQRSPAEVKALATGTISYAVVDGSLTLRKSPSAYASWGAGRELADLSRPGDAVASHC